MIRPKLIHWHTNINIEQIQVIKETIACLGDKYYMFYE